MPNITYTKALRRIVLGLAGGVLMLVRVSGAADVVRTYTYKRVAGLAIKADVHRADDSKTRPAVVWIHGGALIMGGRQGISGRVKRTFIP